MARTRSGGGWSAIWYTIEKSLRAANGPLDFWRRMASRNACKTCALGMGGQSGGMRNEAGHFPEFCKKSVQAMAADLQPPIDTMLFHSRTAEELARYTPRQLENLGRLSHPLIRETRTLSFGRSPGMRRSTAPPGPCGTPPRIAVSSTLRAAAAMRPPFFAMARARYGTNNVNNCSYYCHQASGVGLSHSIRLRCRHRHARRCSRAPISPW